MEDGVGHEEAAKRMITRVSVVWILSLCLVWKQALRLHTLPPVTKSCNGVAVSLQPRLHVPHCNFWWLAGVSFPFVWIPFFLFAKLQLGKLLAKQIISLNASGFLDCTAFFCHFANRFPLQNSRAFVTLRSFRVQTHLEQSAPSPFHAWTVFTRLQTSGTPDFQLFGLCLLLQTKTDVVSEGRLN